ncbi:MAG: hypothetical protein SFU21_15080 [Flavihumibacter sp.]|nr:hypothetical protein [Flavihumibacter sp.]
MNAVSLTIIHPAFENLKRTGRLLHLLAGMAILANAFSLYRNPTINPVYFWCQLIVAIDIVLLVFLTRNLVEELPKINLAFRLTETLTLLAAAIIFFSEERHLMSAALLLASMAFAYLLYCEQKVNQPEILSIHHTGISLPGLPSGQFFIWSKINAIEARYDSIQIQTADKSWQFPLRKNIGFEELDQIHDFCKHYLGK